MMVPGILQIVLFFALLLLVTRPLGAFMARVYSGQRTFLDPVVGPLERLVYRLCGVDPAAEQGWRLYTVCLLLFNLVGALLLYALLRLQEYLPFNPQAMSNVAPDLAFNTAVSFTTNTNWQNYGGESTLGYLVQMTGLTVHNFVSAATGMAIAIALTRGFARRSTQSVGNFWVDLVRGTLYILLPISIVGAVLLVALGIPQNLNEYTAAITVEGATQTIAQGPVASQEVIKELGTNGGGFFNANSAHPFENPTPLTNFITNFLILIIPAGLFYTFGRLVGDTRQGWVLWAASATILLLGLVVALGFEWAGNPRLTALGVDQSVTPFQAGGNLEGKETRFGIAASVLWAVVTTATSCGAVNAMHDSLTPIAGLVPLVNLKLGEIVFGGVGAGLYGMLVYAVIGVFLAGLMVGRTPEYLGKKIESFEIKMASLVVVVLALSVLGFSGLSVVGDWGTASLANAGPHGLSEVLYAFASTTGNNGSAFAGLSGNTLYWNTTLGIAMLVGRFLMIVPVMALAGSMARKRRVPPSLGTFPTTGPIWVSLLVGVILIVGALTYFPALSLGPIVEQLLLAAGKTFS